MLSCVFPSLCSRAKVIVGSRPHPERISYDINSLYRGPSASNPTVELNALIHWIAALSAK